MADKQDKDLVSQVYFQSLLHQGQREQAYAPLFRMRPPAGD